MNIFHTASAGPALIKIAAGVLGLSLATGVAPGKEQPASRAVTRIENLPGVIVIAIHGNGARNDHSWQYEIEPSAGRIRMTQNLTVKPDFQGPVIDLGKFAGRLGFCNGPKSKDAISLEGKVVARCSTPVRSDKEELTVLNPTTSAVIYRWPHEKGRGISGFLWSTDSKYLIVLNDSEYYGKDPLGLLAGISGHPIPHNTVYLDIIDTRSWTLVEYLVRKDVLYASSQILDWSSQ